MKNKKTIIFAVSLSLAISALYYTLFSRERVRSGFESGTIKATKEVLLSFQESYKSEYKEYNTNVEELRKSVILVNHVKIFFKEDEVPLEIVSRISSSDMPFLEKERYSVLVSIEKKEIDYISIWKLSQDGTLTKIYPKK